MKTSVFYAVLITVTLGISWAIYAFLLPEFIREGGPLVVALLTLTLMVFTLVVERLLSLRKSEGVRPHAAFLKDVFRAVEAGEIDRAIELCRAQRGTLAGVLLSGLESYQGLRSEGVEDPAEAKVELQGAIEETTTLELPILENNLVALSTIASIATMVGLLGTVIGMIRSFRALAHAGAPDAVQLSIGISEALINTAGGLVAAISAIIAYNYFVTRIDNYTYAIDEAGALLVRALMRPHSRRRSYRAGASHA